MKNTKFIIRAALVVVIAILFVLSFKNLISFITFAILVGISAITHSFLIYKFENYETTIEKKFSKYSFIKKSISTIILLATITLTSLYIISANVFIIIFLLIIVIDYISDKKLNKLIKTNTEKEINEESV